jgi:hypothetical protein
MCVQLGAAAHPGAVGEHRRAARAGDAGAAVPRQILHIAPPSALPAVLPRCHLPAVRARHNALAPACTHRSRHPLSCMQHGFMCHPMRCPSPPATLARSSELRAPPDSSSPQSRRGGVPMALGSVLALCLTTRRDVNSTAEAYKPLWARSRQTCRNAKRGGLDDSVSCFLSHRTSGSMLSHEVTALASLTYPSQRVAEPAPPST